MGGEWGWGGGRGGVGWVRIVEENCKEINSTIERSKNKDNTPKVIKKMFGKAEKKTF